MPNYENFITFDYWQYEVIRHAFSFTAAVFAASLVYFAMTMHEATAKYRTTFAISAVVMVSATIELGLLYVMWNDSFAYDETTMTYARMEGAIFANGYRYANWLIDVPMLLTQFLIVLQFTGAELRNRWVKLAGAGALMIILGYIGQYYEPQVAGFAEGSGAGFWIWGGLSWLVFFYLLYVANDSVKEGTRNLTEDARGLMDNAWKLLAITWFMYGFAYLVPGIPGINQSADWVVVRQLIYTFADVTSKTVFGIMLAQVAIRQSRAESASGVAARGAAEAAK
jgi:hypothetical protein